MLALLNSWLLDLTKMKQLKVILSYIVNWAILSYVRKNQRKERGEGMELGKKGGQNRGTRGVDQSIEVGPP